MANKAVAVLGFTLLVLLGVISIPIAVDSTDSTSVESVTLSEGESTEINGGISVSVVTTEKTETNVTVVNTESGDSISRTILEGSTETFSFSEGDIQITAVETTNQNAVLSVEYPNTFGYNENMNLITDNLELILIVMLFIGVMAFVGVGGSKL